MKNTAVDEWPLWLLSPHSGRERFTAATSFISSLFIVILEVLPPCLAVGWYGVFWGVYSSLDGLAWRLSFEFQLELFTFYIQIFLGASVSLSFTLFMITDCAYLPTFLTAAFLCTHLQEDIYWRAVVCNDR